MMDSSGELRTLPLSEAEQVEAQRRLWALLTHQARLYTMGESSSLPVETVEELLASLCFTLRCKEDDAEGMRRLLREDPQTLLNRGQQRLRAKVFHGKRLWQSLCLDIPPWASRSLTETLQEIGAFWTTYDLRFFAHLVSGDLDYQLCVPIPETTQGVDYVNQFLYQLNLENRFAQRFPPERVASLLKMGAPNYREQITNLYEPVAVQALGLTLIDGDVEALRCTATERAALSSSLALLDRKAQLDCLTVAVEQLSERMTLETGERRYLLTTAQALAPRLTQALESGDLSAIFPGES